MVSVIELCCDQVKKRRHFGVNIHTMTIRRILVSVRLRAELFFYSQFKDNESHHRIETAFAG